jgi:hypothetical protein
MSLTLNCADAPFEYFREGTERRYSPDYILVENRVFENERLVIDNHQSRRCSFRGCTLVYGGAPFGFVECDFDGCCEPALTGAAIRAVAFLEALAQSPNRYPGL